MSNAPALDNTPAGWRWAPYFVLAYVALWPTPGIAEGVLALGAMAAIVQLLWVRFRDGGRLLSHAAWALTSVLFFAYWLPQALSSVDALQQREAMQKSLLALRYLPFLWLVAIAVATPQGRRLTFGGIGVIVLVWVLDGLFETASGHSALFSALDAGKQAISGHGFCTAQEVAALDRLAGVLGPCNLKLGIIIASLSPFALHLAQRRAGLVGWLLAAGLVGIVILLAGSRASWITYGLVLLLSGWHVLGWKKLLGLLLFGVLALGALTAVSPHVRERVMRTVPLLHARNDVRGAETALSGRVKIWSAAVCMARTHPVNGVGARDFRDAFPACDPDPTQKGAWGDGPALHAHQIVLEILSETGVLGLLLWLAGAAMAWRAWRYAGAAAKERAYPAMVALAVTVFPFNTHLAFYSSFWGGVTLLLAALYAGSLLAQSSGDDAVDQA